MLPTLLPTSFSRGSFALFVEHATQLFHCSFALFVEHATQLSMLRYIWRCHFRLAGALLQLLPPEVQVFSLISHFIDALLDVPHRPSSSLWATRARPTSSAARTRPRPSTPRRCARQCRAARPRPPRWRRSSPPSCSPRTMPASSTASSSSTPPSSL